MVAQKAPLGHTSEGIFQDDDTRYYTLSADKQADNDILSIFC